MLPADKDKSKDNVKLMPHSNDAEQAILGNLMRDPWLIPEAIRLLSADEFYSYANKRIFEALVSISDAGKHADYVSVHEWLTAKKVIEDCGGAAYLGELTQKCSSAANISHHAEIIRNYATRRDMIDACAELSSEAWHPSTVGPDLIDSAERKIREIADRGATGEAITLQKAITESYDRMDRRSGKESIDGVPSGFIDLDNLTAGFQASELVILAARPSVGKTMLSLQIALNGARETDEPVLFVSLEQARIEISDRLLCMSSKTDSHRMRRGHLNSDEIANIVSAGEELAKAKLWIDDSPGQNMLRIAAGARRMQQQHGLKMIVIDYLQLIESEREDRRANRQEQVSAISRRLKMLARELRVPVLALAQLNRSSEDRAGGKPRLSDLRESGAIEQDADTVMLMHRQNDDASAATVPIDLIVAKQRNGPIGEVTLVYVRSHMRFENFAVDHS